MKNTVYQICLWLNDKETKIQEISTESALELVNKFTVKYFWAWTIHAGNWVYSHEDWTIVIEKTIIIDLITEKPVNEYIETLKKVFNQESVLVKKSIENVEFL